MRPDTEKNRRAVAANKKKGRGSGDDEVKTRRQKTVTGRGPVASGPQGQNNKTTTTTKTPTPKAESTKKTTTPDKIATVKYKIKSGDTLSAIAKRAGTTVAALMSANPSIKDKNKIRAGQSITIAPKGQYKSKPAKPKASKIETAAERTARRKRQTEYEKLQKDIKSAKTKRDLQSVINKPSSKSVPKTITKVGPDGIKREYQLRPGGKGLRNFNLKK
tara:strand:- start:5889 stop:6542 length:654 start_codon:yes stop_codon:yes gene_type:complete